MIFGFTGTRHGLASRQASALRARAERATLLYEDDGITLHHGDCVGADEAMHHIATRERWTVEVHPPDDEKFRAFCEGHVIHVPRPYLERNREIVASCDVLIACPQTERMEPRGGTWYTIRHAWEVGRPVSIVWPSGRVETLKVPT